MAGVAVLALLVAAVTHSEKIGNAFLFRFILVLLLLANGIECLRYDIRSFRYAAGCRQKVGGGGCSAYPLPPG